MSARTDENMDEGDCRGIKLVRLVVGAARKPQKWSQIYHSKCLAVKLDAHKQPLSQIYHSKCLAVKLDAHKRPLSVLAAELNADLCDECPDGRDLSGVVVVLPDSDLDEGDCRGIKLVRLVVGAARKPQKWSQIYHSKCLAVKLDAHKQPLSQIYHSKCLAVKLDAHKRPLSVLAAELNADLCDECPDGRECVLQHLHHASADCCHRLVVLALMLPFSAHTYRGCSHLCSADMDEGDCRGIKLVRLVVGAARKPQKWSQIYHSKCLAVKLDAHKQPLSQIYHSKCLAVKLDAHKRPLSVLAAELNADLCDECPDGRDLSGVVVVLPDSDLDEGDCRGIKLVRLVVGAARKPQKWSQIYHSKCLAVKLDAHKQPLSQIYHSKCLAVKLDAHKRPLSVLAAELNADLCDECPDGRECVLQHLHHASADCCHRLVVLALMLPFSAHTYRGCSHLCSADMDEGDCRGIKLVRLVVGAARKPQKWSQIYHSKCLAVKLDAHKQPLSQIYHSKCLAVKLDAHKRPLSVLAAELNADLCDECPDGRECVLQHLHHASADCCHRLVVLALMLPFSAHTYRGCSHVSSCF
ncbi:uncharacterized protein V6R79_022100 [Siganus canaliculatus]